MYEKILKRLPSDERPLVNPSPRTETEILAAVRATAIRFGFFDPPPERLFDEPFMTVVESERHDG